MQPTSNYRNNPYLPQIPSWQINVHPAKSSLVKLCVDQIFASFNPGKLETIVNQLTPLDPKLWHSKLADKFNEWETGILLSTQPQGGWKVTSRYARHWHYKYLVKILGDQVVKYVFDCRPYNPYPQKRAGRPFPANSAFAYINETVPLCPHMTQLVVKDDSSGLKLDDEKVGQMLKLTMPRLTYLKIQNCKKLTKDTIVSIIAFAPNLTHLSLKGCNFTVEDIKGLSLLRKLQALNVTRCPYLQEEFELSEGVKVIKDEDMDIPTPPLFYDESDEDEVEYRSPPRKMQRLE